LAVNDVNSTRTRQGPLQLTIGNASITIRGPHSEDLMGVIDLKSEAIAPSPAFPRPRWEIGHYFVNIYYVPDRYQWADQRNITSAARKLCGSLGEKAPMVINERHPSVPASNAHGSSKTGTSEEMHDEPQKLGHLHVELVGANRDTGFAALGVRDALVNKLTQLLGK
jgi:hypothetical protein